MSEDSTSPTKGKRPYYRPTTADKPWQTAEELTVLLTAFLADYNDRPHQGRELAGLSPNEYAARLLAA